MPQEKFLIIQTAFLGDAILTLPFIQKLGEIYSTSKIDVVCIPDTSEVFIASKFVNDVLIYDKKKKQKSLRETIKFAKQIKERNYTRIYSPHRSLRTSLIVSLSNVKETYGFNNASLNFVYRSKVYYHYTRHEVARNLEFIKEKDISDWKILPDISIDENSINRVNELISFVNKPKVAIAPGSVWNTKRYPKEYYVELSKEIINDGYFVVYIGSKEDVDLCNEITSHFSESSLSLAGKLSIVESIYLLKKCSLLICNDSAPTHMGMAADIPVITIYCSTIPSFGFYPYNDKSKFLSYDDLKCKPCGIHGRKKCPIKKFDCGYKLYPKSVFKEVKLILGSVII